MLAIQSISNHIVILGWSERVERIIAELRNPVHQGSNDLRPILVITPDTTTSPSSHFERVYFIFGRINDVEVLRRARLEVAHALLIPCALRDTGVSDGETIFSLLAALAVSPKMRVCVELAEPGNGTTLNLIRERNLNNGEIEIVSLESVADRLLAQAAINRGVTRVYDHLLSFSETTNELYVCDLGAEWEGKTFRDLAMECFERHVILLGFERAGELILNPEDRGARLLNGDLIWYMALNRSAGIAIINRDRSRSHEQ